ncbi:MAG: class I SAM-dependent methyltransferase [Candidatus Thorarchaeota archaeon]
MNNIVRKWFLKNLEARIFYRNLIRKKIIKKLPQAILEIGCGRGDGILIHEQYYHPKIHNAFDIDKRLVELALRKKKCLRLNHIKIDVGDVRDINAPDEIFDAVFGYGVLHHVKNWQTGLKEINRVLKYQGIYCWEEPFQYFNNLFISKLLLSHPDVNMTYKNWWKELERASFKNIFEWPIKNPFITLGISVKK